MTPVKTAKPCPSAQKKTPKLKWLLKILNFLACVYRVFKFLDACYDWLKNHWTSVWESLQSLKDLFS